MMTDAPRTGATESEAPSQQAGGGLAWGGIHDPDASLRKKLIGEISDAFVLPRYVRLFYDTFGHAEAQDFLEIGAGNGENSRAILAANRGEIRRYIATEVFDEGVAWLRKQGLEAERASAEALPFSDASFTAAIS